MQIIKKLCDMMDEEISDAEKYIRCALTHREDYPGLAETFARLSDEELRHVSMLHEQTVKLIEEHRRTKGEPPADMMAVYKYLHEKQTDRAADVKLLQEMYKGR